LGGKLQITIKVMPVAGISAYDNYWREREVLEARATTVSMRSVARCMGRRRVFPP